METFSVKLRPKWQLTFPRQMRELLGVGIGDELIFYRNEQQQFVIERQQTIPADQAWFWTKRWQQMEREAQAEIDAGREMEFENVEDAIGYLHEVANAED